MYRAYKFRLYPNCIQKKLINKMFGCTRFVYNYYLEKIKMEGYTYAYDNIKDYVSNLKYKSAFLQEIDSIVIRKSIFNLDSAYQKMYKEGKGIPVFKSRFGKNSYNTNAIYNTYKDKQYCNIELDLIKRQVKLPKLKWVKIRGYRNKTKIQGKTKSATISRDVNGKYYVSLLYEIPEVEVSSNPKSIVGLDLGVKKLITLSNGISYDNNKYILKYEKRIKRKQRELSRKEKNSNNYYKCKRELARLYTKLKNARKYYIHKITKEITDIYDIIVTETLHSKEMIIKGKKNNLSKSISDASFNEIIRQLLYKCKYKGKQFYKANEYYVSSRICSLCGNRNDEYKDLNKREYKCNSCGLRIDRDLNASINIMNEGISMYMKELRV